MKQTLSLFILTILLSYALTTAVVATVHSLTSSTKWSRKDSILKAGRLIHSRTGGFTLTLTEGTCQMVLRNNEQKVLFQTPVQKDKKCRLILRGNSNLEIQFGKVIVWSTATAPKHGGKGPYRLTINRLGNPIIRNNQKECVWALFGCPIPAAVVNRIKNAPPKQAFAHIKSMEKKRLAARRNVSPLRSLPIARGKPVIKNQVPKFVKRNSNRDQKPRAIPKRLGLPQKKLEKVQNLLTGTRTRRNVRGIVRTLGLKGKPARQITRLLIGGYTWPQINKRVLRTLAKKVKKAKRTNRLKRQRRRSARKINVFKRFRTRRQVRKAVRKLTWIEQAKIAFNQRKGYETVRKILVSMGNVRGSDYFWTQMQDAYNNNNWNELFKLISLPPQRALSVQRPKRWVTRGRWVLKYITYQTWRWAIGYTGSWVRHCRRWWRWWTRCWWSYTTTGYWYQYWYWTGYHKWQYETYQNLE
jgi:hypothetical protein